MIGVSVKGELFIRGRKVRGKHSPTSTYKTDILDELHASGGTAVVGAVDKVAFVDTNGTERDSATPTISFIEKDGKEWVRFRADITVTESYHVAKVRLYSGTKLYFEYTLDTAEYVSKGEIVVAIYDVSHEVTTTTANASITYQSLATGLNHIIGNDRGTKYININYICWTWVDTSAVAHDETRTPDSKVKDTANMVEKVTAPTWQAPSGADYILKVWIADPDQVSLVTVQWTAGNEPSLTPGDYYVIKFNQYV